MASKRGRPNEALNVVIYLLRQLSGSKGSRKNNFTFLHPIFRLSLSDSQPQNPRKSPTITVVLRFRIEQS